MLHAVCRVRVVLPWEFSAVFKFVQSIKDLNVVRNLCVLIHSFQILGQKREVYCITFFSLKGAAEKRFDCEGSLMTTCVLRCRREILQKRIKLFVGLRVRTFLVRTAQFKKLKGKERKMQIDLTSIQNSIHHGCQKAINIRSLLDGYS